jgi:hypothetical protein
MEHMWISSLEMAISRSEKLCSSDHGFVDMHLDKLSILFGLFLT